MMGRKNVQKGRYKDQLIKDKYVVKLLVYFQMNGICKFSMSELANDFQISKTTLYNHFESKEEMVERALDYKLGVIGEYESVLENITLSYTERYRKSMLFFCVQSFDVSSVLLKEIKDEYPMLWIKVQHFQKNVFDNLKSYYRIGKEIGIFSEDANPFLLSLSDQQFFELLSQKNIIDKIELDIISVFNHHYKMRFNGILK